MDENHQLRVNVDGVERVFPQGTTYQAVAESVRDRYPYDILLSSRDGLLFELADTLDRSCTLHMMTAQDKPGFQAYERSAVLLMLKSFYDVVGRENVETISVEYSLSHALFILTKGHFSLDQSLLDRVADRMRELVSRRIPIQKRIVATYDAINLFREAGLNRKARLLEYRMDHHVNVYSLDGFVDYFYGPMVPDTGYIKWFDLEQYECGFVLRLPSQAQPDRLGAFRPSRKVFQTMYASTLRSQALNASCVADLNAVVAQGNATQLILAYEAMMEKQIGDIAAQIAARKDVRFVMIAGPSSSGKTTFSHRLSTQLRSCGLHPHPIATDDYFKNREDTPRDEHGNHDFESLGAMDVALFNDHMMRLLQGETVELPTFNFKKGCREYTGHTLHLGEGDVLVIEGIHCLNDQFTCALPDASKYKIYISCLTTLNIDDHNRIPTTDARLLRRIERDARVRGYSAQATIRMWPSVRRGEENNIFPFQDSADVIFNSALIYETSLLKPYVQPLLFGVPRDSGEYLEARRLLRFLEGFLPIPADDVPKTSLIREFIGGGCYHT